MQSLPPGSGGGATVSLPRPLSYSRPLEQTSWPQAAQPALKAHYSACRDGAHPGGQCVISVSCYLRDAIIDHTRGSKRFAWGAQDTEAAHVIFRLLVGMRYERLIKSTSMICDMLLCAEDVEIIHQHCRQQFANLANGTVGIQMATMAT